MEIKGIDVSSYQGKPDWSKVSNSGIKFAILRIHQKSGIDTSLNIITKVVNPMEFLLVDTSTATL